MGTMLYSVGDPVVCHTFGSVRGFRATIEELHESGEPRYFRDRQGTLITPADVVSFEHRPKLFKFGAHVTRWKEDKNGDRIGRSWTEEIHFRLPRVAEHSDLVFAKAKETAAKRWKRYWEVTETWMCPIRCQHG